jgi:DNA polymerase
MTERNFWFDLETRSPVPIKNGTHAYAEKAEVLLWAYADGEGEPRVWDVANGTDGGPDELSGLWVEEPCDGIPSAVAEAMADENVLFWGHNAGMFDFVVLAATAPWFTVPMRRWRDTMVQAFAHSLPGALDKLGEILQLHDDDRKLKDEGRKYIRLFCIPKDDGTYNDKASHPVEWAGFIRYAARDITTMRAAHWKMPKWNYRG